jgi:hypothetical protein
MNAALTKRAPIPDIDLHIRSLERLLRRKTVEIEFLQEELRDARARKHAEVLRDQAIETLAQHYRCNAIPAG